MTCSTKVGPVAGSPLDEKRLSIATEAARFISDMTHQRFLNFQVHNNSLADNETVRSGVALATPLPRNPGRNLQYLDNELDCVLDSRQARISARVVERKPKSLQGNREKSRSGVKLEGSPV